MHRIARLFLVSLFFHVLSNNFLHAQEMLTGKVLQQLDSIATQDVPAGAPGIATAIIVNGELVYQKWAGYADLEDSLPLSPISRFNIASNGKQFTALAILQLTDQKKLQLSDDIREFLPDLFAGIPHKITIEHLLTHTSGIRDVYDLLSLNGQTWWKLSLNNKDVLSILSKQQNLNFKPGSSYLYSNSNYILLAMIIEKVSGQPFAWYMKRLFQHLGMTDTSFEPDHTAIPGPIARPYFNFNQWTTYQWMWNVCGDGNLFSTLTDQIQWEKLVQGKSGSGIKPELIKKSQDLVNPVLTNKYGYGLEFGTYKGLKYTFHEGATGAWKATCIRFPAKKVSIITLANTGKAIPYSQTRQMADLLLGLQPESYKTKPVNTGPYVSMDDIPGVYISDNNFAFEFVKMDSALYLRRNGRNDVKLEREAGNVFRQANDWAFKQEFTKNRKGEMQVTAYYVTHAPYTLIRPDADWTKFTGTSLNGTYVNEEMNTAMNIKHSNGRTFHVWIGNNNEPMTGNLVLPDKLLAGPYSITVFNRGNAKWLLLDGDRIKQVKFDRK